MPEVHFLQVGSPTVELLRPGLENSWPFSSIKASVVDQLVQLSLNRPVLALLDLPARRTYFEEQIAGAPHRGVVVFRRLGEEQISGFTVFFIQPPAGLRKQLVLELVKLVMPDLAPDPDWLIFAYRQILWLALKSQLLPAAAELEVHIWYDLDQLHVRDLLA